MKTLRKNHEVTVIFTDGKTVRGRVLSGGNMLLAVRTEDGDTLGVFVWDAEVDVQNRTIRLKEIVDNRPSIVGGSIND